MKIIAIFMLFLCIVSASKLKLMEKVQENRRLQSEVENQIIEKYKKNPITQNIFELNHNDTLYGEKLMAIMLTADRHGTQFQIPGYLYKNYQQGAKNGQFTIQDLIDQENDLFKTARNYGRRLMKKFDNETYKDYMMQIHNIGKYQNTTDKWKQFRFLQMSEENLNKLKEDVISDEQYEVPVINCYASSNYVVINWNATSRQSSVDYRGFPCVSATGYGRKYEQAWYSGILWGERRNQVVTFAGYFQRQTRLTELEISWVQAPLELELMVTKDRKNFITSIKMTKTRDINDLDGSYQGKASFEQNIVLPSPQWVNGFKLLMKTPWEGSVMGITALAAFAKDFTCQIRNVYDDDLCITRQNPDYYEDNARLHVFSCLKSVLINDAREIFVINPENFNIYNYVDEFCIKYPSTKDGTNLQLVKCLAPSHKESIQWEAIKQGDHDIWKIKTFRDSQMCMTYTTKENTGNVAQYKNVTVVTNHTANSIQFNPKFILSDDENEFWRSQEGQRKSHVTIYLPSLQTIEKVKIIWGTDPPKGYQIYFFKEDDIMEVVHVDRDNTQSTVELQFNPLYIYGMKIYMFEYMQPDLAPWFTIQQVIIETGGNDLAIQNCEELGERAEWIIDEITYIDLSAFGGWLIESQESDKTVESLLLSIDKLLNERAKVPILTRNAKQFSKKIQSLQEFMNEFDNELQLFRPVLEISEQIQQISLEEGEDIIEPSKPKVGTSPTNPGKACYRIKLLYPYKKSGYYWIQGKCHEIPLRMYCDFETETKQAYIFLSSDDYAIQLKERQDYEEFCNQLGMESLVMAEGKVKTIIQIIGDLDIDLKQQAVVPLGFDYTCDKKDGCQRQFKQWKNFNTPDLTKELVTKIDNNNMLNSPFVINRRSRNGIGLGMSDTKLLLFQLGEVPILGLVCSTNILPNDSPSTQEPIDCDTKVLGNQLFDGVPDSQIKVLCPPGCASQEQFEVFGSTKFSSQSSICRAAILTGALEDLFGGEINVTIGEPLEQYEGASQNEITSKAAPGVETEPSFMITIVEYDCPQDKLDQKSSFYQKKMQVSYKDESVFKKKIQKTDIKNDPKILKNSFIQLRSKARKSKIQKNTQQLIDQIREFEKSRLQVSQNSFLQENVSDFAIKLKNLMQIKSQVQKNTSITNTNSSSFIDIYTKMDSNMQKDEEQKGEDSDSSEEEDEEEEEEKVPKTTKTLLQEVDQLFQQDQFDFSQQINLVKDAQKLIEFMSKEFAALAGTSEDPKVQLQVLNGLFNGMEGTLGYLGEITKDAVSKRMVLMNDYYDLLLEKISLMKWQPYEEVYYFKIHDMYLTFDEAEAQGGASDWQISNQMLENHDTAIICTTKKSFQDGVPTGITLKYKFVYDIKVYFAYLIKDTGNGGILLHFKDQYNYIMIEISFTGFRALRMENGVLTLLRQKEYSLLQNKWYRIWVKTERNSYFLKIISENDPDDERQDYQKMKEVDSENKNMNEEVNEHDDEVAFEFEDHNMKSGYVGFFSNSSSFVAYDKIYYEPLDCQDIVDKPHEYTFVPENTNRFYENYKGGPLEIRYDIEQPDEMKDGPGKWDVGKNLEGRAKAIFQSTQVKSDHIQQIGTRLIKKDFIFKDGVIKLNFFMLQKGKIGVIFRMKSQGTYYRLVLGFNGIYLYYHDQGAMLPVIEQEEYEVEKNVWYKLRIETQEGEAMIYINKFGEPEYKLFEGFDWDIAEIDQGTWGLETFGVQCYFDDIHVKAHHDVYLEWYWSQRNPGNMDKSDSSSSELEDELKEEIEDICLNAPYYETRLSWCELHVSDKNEPVEFCVDNFCEECCLDQGIEGDDVAIQTCEKQCKEQPYLSKDPDESWKICQESLVPKRSAQQFCSKIFLDKEDLKNCNISNCNLCCVMSEEFTDIPVDNESMQRCFAACYNDFIQSEADNLSLAPKTDKIAQHQIERNNVYKHFMEKDQD